MPFSAGLIADRVRRLAVRDLPDDLALIEIDRGDGSVRRLDQRQTLHVSRLRRHRPPRHLAATARAGALAGIGESAPAFSPGPARCVTSLPGGAGHDNSCPKCLRRTHQADRRQAGVARIRIDDVRFRIVRRRPASWSRRSPCPASASPADRSSLLSDRRREHRPDACISRSRSAPASCSAGVKSIRSSVETPLRL